MNRQIIAIVLLVVLGVAIAAYFLMDKDKPADDNNGNRPPGPAVYTNAIDSVFRHDTSFFTQGLVFYKGQLYEGTGLNGKSRLMKIDMSTGRALKQYDLDSAHFGEGITILNDTIYQLTWQSRKAFAYVETPNGFKRVKEFSIKTEGWGLTNDARHLIASDGSNNLYFYEPSSFTLLKTLPVTEAGALVYNINELEYINGHVYANQWGLPYLLIIDPATGVVVAKSDLQELWDQVKRKEPRSDVPNGIAYDSISKKIYITGKNWPELYQVSFSK